ncbi:hypothetical protein KC19_10G164400 [Ceratodon purpureus]|uniref:Uncharacterized protein n=1 Tax=Ceratodon purpureus TaxID=3225 RepID=A0A8T0GMI9_CERPU|nr:hypothetical protein KC19_10G164400 [Ceratodon purpureus]
MAYTRPFRLRPAMMVLVLALIAMLVIQPMLVAAKKGGDKKKEKDDDDVKSGDKDDDGDSGKGKGKGKGNDVEEKKGGGDEKKKGDGDEKKKGGGDEKKKGGGDEKKKGGGEVEEGPEADHEEGPEAEGTGEGPKEGGAGGGKPEGGAGAGKEEGAEAGPEEGAEAEGTGEGPEQGEAGAEEGAEAGPQEGAEAEGTGEGTQEAGGAGAGEEEGAEAEGTGAEGPEEEGTEAGPEAGNGESEAGKKPNCKKKGSMCGDPKIIGGDGVTFYFEGRKNQDFCLVSDSDLHINAHFIGIRPEGRTREFTWVQALGLVFGRHSLTVAVKSVGEWDSKIDQLEFSYNGVPFSLDSWWISPNGVMKLNRIGATNAVDLVIKEKMGVSVTAIPVTKEENRVHRYGITDDDCFAHFDMQFRFYNLSSSVNGVLGQTYQPGFVNAMKTMGGADRFASSSLLATDCKASQYTASPVPPSSAMPSFEVACGSSGKPSGVPGGITCRR